jgi:hypothetical protein
VEEDGSFRFEKTEVVAVLACICLEQSRHDPQMTERLAELKTAATYSRSVFIMKVRLGTDAWYDRCEPPACERLRREARDA